MQLWLVLKLLYRPDWPGTQKDLLAFASLLIAEVKGMHH